jgi:hypothetical protein
VVPLETFGRKDEIQARPDTDASCGTSRGWKPLVDNTNGVYSGCKLKRT